MNRITKAITLFLLPFVGVGIALAQQTGNDNLTYTLSVDGTLTITSGNINCTNAMPWASEAQRIYKVVINSGVTASNCTNLFADCTNLTDVNLSGLSTTMNETPCTSMFGTITPGIITFPEKYDLGFPTETSYYASSTPLQYTQDYPISDYKQRAIANRAEQTFVLVKTISQTLTVGSTGLSTLCYPADVNFYGNDGFKDFRAFVVSGIEPSTTSDISYLVLTEIDNSDEEAIIPAHTPVIIYKPGGGDIVLGVATNVSMAPVAVKQSGNLLVGANNRFRINDPNYYVLQKGGKGVGYYQINPNGQSPITMSPYRCYLDLTEVSASSNMFSFEIPDELTNIESTAIQADNAPKPGIYDLNGTPVANPQKGKIYIMNGCKVLIK